VGNGDHSSAVEGQWGIDARGLKLADYPVTSSDNPFTVGRRPAQVRGVNRQITMAASRAVSVRHTRGGSGADTWGDPHCKCAR
jgi:hypothetical protein